jgi:cyclic pyranopterin monophosphate synthase
MNQEPDSSPNSRNNPLTHVDAKGKATMVDVSNKPDQIRMAKASGRINLMPGTIQMISENQLKKGDVLTVVQVAGIQAAKETSKLIPLCHPILISKIEVKLEIDEKGIFCESMIKCIGHTGVEMEALTAVSVALLTVYDMCKAVDKQMEIDGVKLIEKTKTDII